MTDNNCNHPPSRYYSWYAVDGTLCVCCCCDCGAALKLRAAPEDHPTGPNQALYALVQEARELVTESFYDPLGFDDDAKGRTRLLAQLNTFPRDFPTLRRLVLEIGSRLERTIYETNAYGTRLVSGWEGYADEPILAHYRAFAEEDRQLAAQRREGAVQLRLPLR